MKKFARVEEEIKNLRQDFQKWKNEAKEELISSSCLKIGELLDPIQAQISGVHAQNSSLMVAMQKLKESTAQEMGTHSNTVRQYTRELGVTQGFCTDQGGRVQEVTTQRSETSREVSDPDQSGQLSDGFTEEENLTQEQSSSEEFYQLENADQFVWQLPALEENHSFLVPFGTPVSNLSQHVYGWSGELSHVDSICYIPSDGLVFIIPDCDQLVTLRQDFHTDFFYTRGKLCKARFRIWFNKRGRMGVSALLSQGTMDDQHQWPLCVAGYGQIYNPTSRKFSKIWQVDGQECQKPQAGVETPLGAAVQLCTSRTTCDDVTQSVLVKRHYMDHTNTLVFRCYLKAEEVKVQLDPLQLEMTS